MITDLTHDPTPNEERLWTKQPEGHLRHATQITIITGLVISTSFLGIRLYLTRRVRKELTTEDLCLTLAWGFCAATQAIILYALDHAGLGVHISLLTRELIETYQKLLTIAACLFVAGLCLARLSYLIFFHRLMMAKKWLRWSLYIVATFIIVASSVIVCTFIFACQPVAKSWDISLKGKCLDRAAVFVAVAVLNIISDLCLLLLPVPIILELHASRVQKAKIMIILCVVCITFVASAIRLRFTIPLLRSTDLTYGIAPVSLLVGIESSLVIITASLPVVKQFVCVSIVSATQQMNRAIIKRLRKMLANTSQDDRQGSVRISRVLGEELPMPERDSWAREVLAFDRPTSV